MNNKNRKKEIEKMIFSGFKNLSPNEIRRLIDKEISKDESEIDIAYLDTCFELLEIKESQSTEKSKKIKLRKSIKIILIAAIFTTLMATAVSATAKVYHFEVSDKIVSVYDDFFDINLGNADIQAYNDIKNKNGINAYVENYGFEEMILPSVFNNETWKINDTLLENLESGERLQVNLSNEKTTAYININHVNSEIWMQDSRKIDRDYELAHQITISDVDIIIFSDNGTNIISYRKDLNDYWIHIENCTFDDAVEIAKTIK